MRLDRGGGGADDGGLRQLAAPQQAALRPPRPVSGSGPRFSFNLNNYTIIPQTTDTLTLSSKFCKNIFPKIYIFS